MGERCDAIRPPCTIATPHEHRWEWYDIRKDIFWREVTTAELMTLAQHRERQGLPRLVFHSPTDDVHRFAEATHLTSEAKALREVLHMAWDGTAQTGFGAVLHRAVELLRDLRAAPAQEAD